MAFLPQPQFSTAQIPYNNAFSFQPQSTWGGIDYYRAHALNPETSLYEDAWGRVRDRNSLANDGLGIGMDEARHRHRRAYEIPGEINRMSPTEIGHAAAYEAYKTWLRNSAMYEVVGEDRERQREGLVGIAVAEVTRLLQYSAHQADGYAQTIAADAAAHTVTVLFYQGQDDYPRSRSRMRAGSFSGSYAGSYARSAMMDPMADDMWPQHLTPSLHNRSRSRSRHSRRHYSSSPSPDRYRHRSRSRVYGDYPNSGAIPGQMSYAASYAGYPTSSASYNGTYMNNAWPSPTGNTMLPNQIYTTSYPTQQLPVAYPGQAVSMGTPYQAPLYNSPVAVPLARSNSFTYPNMVYPGTPWSATSAMPTQAPTVVVVGSKRKHRRHRHR